MKKHFLYFLFAASLLLSCGSDQGQPAKPDPAKDTAAVVTDTIQQKPVLADAATIRSRPQVPVYCYHRIEAGRSGTIATDYSVTEGAFREQLRWLSDSGYHTILPDELYAYLTEGKPLPPKPVMLTYDDTRAEHFAIAAKEMERYGFRGVFFIMNISINRPRYMSAEQLRTLADSGHCIASHTWDHQDARKLKDADWDVQFARPAARLQEITGKPVQYFAYPFGIWTDSAAQSLKRRGVKAAFQLSAPRSATEP
ncbi:MAG TPA: polysaccharide deacetylase family protein, partial [Chitinophagaceae bacterium]|nr:polysaccharide deacetylase family protein [Chitinophagaceae bacterium]